jgi:membrane protease YdiL (CAAX protease family)
MTNTIIMERPTGASLSPERSTPQLLEFVKRHPVVAFYILAFAISWGGILSVIGGPGNVPGTPEQVGNLFLPVMLAWFAGPSVASIVLTGLVYGRAGYRDLLARLLRWRVSLRWYAVSLLAAPIVSVALALALTPRFPELLPNIMATNDRVAVVMMGIAYGIIGGGFLEELGWTGFTAPRLLPRYRVLRTGLIVGVLWGAYHFSVIYRAGNPSGLVPLVILAAQLFAWMPAVRVLMVWVYDRTESLLVIMLMHASLVASMFILQSTTMSGLAQLTFLLMFGALWWVVVGAVALANAGRRGHHALGRRRLGAPAI